MPTVTQQQQGQSSLNTPLPQSAGSPTGGINWILPSPDRTFYAPLFGLMTPTSQPQLSFSTESPNSTSQFVSSQSEFSFDPSCISMTDDPFRQQTQQQTQQQQQQQQQPKYHPWATSDQFDQSTQEQLVTPKQEPFAEYCAGGPPSVETTASHDSSATQQSVGLAEYNPSTSKGHEILSQVGDSFQVKTLSLFSLSPYTRLYDL
jgi:early growth response protein 1